MDTEKPVRTAKASRRRQILAAFALLAGTAIVIFAWQAYRAPRGSALLTAFATFVDTRPADSGERPIGQVILENFKEYRTNARNWSLVYFGSLFLSAVSAALAGAILKLEFLIANERLKKDVAALLAMTSALLVTLSTTGGFQQHWSANRIAAAKIETLAYFFMTADRKKMKLEDISARIQDISFERNAEIVSSNDSHPPASPASPKPAPAE